MTLDTACAKHGSHDMGTISLRKPNLGVASQCELEDIVGLERGGGLGCWSRPATASTLHFKSLSYSSELKTQKTEISLFTSMEAVL